MVAISRPSRSRIANQVCTYNVTCIRVYKQLLLSVLVSVRVSNFDVAI